MILSCAHVCVHKRYRPCFGVFSLLIGCIATSTSDRISSSVSQFTCIHFNPEYNGAKLIRNAGSIPKQEA